MALPVLTPTSQMSKVILPITGTAANITDTAVRNDVYRADTDFISGALDQVSFTYKMLGGDVLDIEIKEENVYSAYENAVLEYSSILNMHQAENVLSNFLGATTGTFDHDGECLEFGGREVFVVGLKRLVRFMLDDSIRVVGFPYNRGHQSQQCQHGYAGVAAGGSLRSTCHSPCGHTTTDSPSGVVVRLSFWKRP